jgi:hypothetical protein
MHLDSQDLIEIGIGHKGVERGAYCRDRQRGKREQMMFTREGREARALEVAGEITAGEGGVAGAQRVSPETERGSGQRGNRAWPRARAGERFSKNRIWRTGQSTVHVRCTPDSAQ